MKNSTGQIGDVDPTGDVVGGVGVVVLEELDGFAVLASVGAGGVSVDEEGADWYPVLVLSPETEEGLFGEAPPVLIDDKPTAFGSGVGVSVGDALDVGEVGVYPIEVRTLL